MKNAEQHYLTKSAAAFIIPIAKIKMNSTYRDLTFHAENYKKADCEHGQSDDTDCDLKIAVFESVW